MAIPTTRKEMMDGVEDAFAKLWDDCEAGGPRIGRLLCTDDWTIKDVIVVRTWWTNSVLDWIQMGLKAEQPVTPAEGFSWRETPQLNQSLVDRSSRQSFKSAKNDLLSAYKRIRPVQSHLTDRQLLRAKEFPWAGSLPVVRWVAMNTTRQYQTARSMIRKAVRTSHST